VILGDIRRVAGLVRRRACARSIDHVSDDLQEKVDFEEREDTLRERFQDAMA
jgi:hypothetical protein